MAGIPASAHLCRWSGREMDPETSWLYVGFCVDVLFFWFSPPRGSCLISSSLRSIHTVLHMEDPDQVEASHLPSPPPGALSLGSWWSAGKVWQQLG